MSFSSGTFSRLYNWVDDRNNTIPITASRMDAEMDDMATGLSQCLLKDGTQTVTADIGFAGFKLTNIGNASADSHALNRITGDGRYILASTVSAFAVTLLDDLTAGAALTTLGVSAFAQTLLDDANAGAALTTLGVSAYAQTILDDANAGAALTTLGISAFVQTILDDADAAAVRTTIGAVNYTDDAELSAIAGLVSAADSLPYFTGSGTAALATFTSAARSLLDDADASAMRTTLGLVIGTNVQAYDAELAAIAGLTSAADRLPYFTGSGTAALATFTSAGRALVDDADASAQRTTLGLVIGTNVQAWDADLDALAALGGTNTIYYRSASNTWSAVTVGTGLSFSAGTLSNSAASGGVESLYVPASAMWAASTNGAAAGTVEVAATQPVLKTLDFDATTKEYAQFAVRMPKSWNESTVTATVLWKHAATATNFGVVWGVAGLALGDSDAAGAAFGTEQTVADTGGTTNDIWITSATSAITIAGTPAEGDLVYFRVARLPADASDTMAIDAGLVGVMINYTTNTYTDA
jgi:hypothetical protein